MALYGKFVRISDLTGGKTVPLRRGELLSDSSRLEPLLFYVANCLFYFIIVAFGDIIVSECDIMFFSLLVVVSFFAKICRTRILRGIQLCSSYLIGSKFSDA